MTKIIQMRDEGIEAYPITKPNCVIDKKKTDWSKMYKVNPHGYAGSLTLCQETEQTH